MLVSAPPVAHPPTYSDAGSAATAIQWKTRFDGTTSSYTRRAGL